VIIHRTAMIPRVRSQGASITKATSIHSSRRGNECFKLSNAAPKTQNAHHRIERVSQMRKNPRRTLMVRLRL
jgi:hypothetical protein